MRGNGWDRKAHRSATSLPSFVQLHERRGGQDAVFSLFSFSTHLRLLTSQRACGVSTLHHVERSVHNARHSPTQVSLFLSSKIQIAAYGGLTSYHKMLTTISVKLTISGVVTLYAMMTTMHVHSLFVAPYQRKGTSKNKHSPAYVMDLSTTTIIVVISVDPLHADVAFIYPVKIKVPMSSTSAAAVVTSPSGGCLVQRERSLLLHACWP